MCLVGVCTVMVFKLSTPQKIFFLNKIIGEGDTAQNVIWFLKNGIVARD